MASSYISGFLRQQGLEKEKNLSRQKVFTERATGEILGQVAHMNMARGTKRRGMSAASESDGADGMQAAMLRKYANEENVKIAERQQVLDWTTAASGTLGAIWAFLAEEADKDEEKKKEEASVAESQVSEEAAMLADHRVEGEEYSPSWLRSPGGTEAVMYDPDGRVHESSVSPDGYFPQGGHVPDPELVTPSSSIYKDEMTATEFKGKRDALAAPETARELVRAQNMKSGRGGLHAPSRMGVPGGMMDEMTREDYERLLFGGAK